MRLLTILTWTTLCLGHVLAVPPQHPPPAYAVVSTQRLPDGRTISVGLPRAVSGFAGKRDMTSEHVPQAWQSNLCNTSAAASSSETLSTASERAPAADCRAMLAWLRANPGYFMAYGFAGQAYAALVVAGRCAFGFYRTDGVAARFDIGNQDVVDLVELAVDAYADAAGLVGAAGQVPCDGATSISWSVYNAVWQEDGTMEPEPLEDGI
ncbi:hypothetical protein F4775DRAFT_575094 [Biscogniauxia sp. FL1348]|nr:hypothetical protein F4775DRAFT_575094 [Biscogniauxia sp. FL1348]